MSSRYVAEYDSERNRIGKIHQAMQPATAKRNRSQYHVKCGYIVRYGLPVPLPFPRAAFCRHCWPLSSLPGGPEDVTA